MNDPTYKLFEKVFNLIIKTTVYQQDHYHIWLSEEERKIWEDFLGKIFIENRVIDDYNIFGTRLLEIIL